MTEFLPRWVLTKISSIQFIEGNIFLQTGKTTRLATVTYVTETDPPEEEEPPEEVPPHETEVVIIDTAGEGMEQDDPQSVTIAESFWSR